VLSANGQTQETKKVKIKNETPPVSTDVFYVLKADPAVKQGEFKRAYDGRLNIYEKGQYANNSKVGIWEYYGEGELQQKVNYDTYELVFTKPFIGISESFILDGSNLKDNNTGKVPTLLGGSSKLFQLMLSNIHYPADAQRMGVEGKIFVSATITKDGKMIDEHVEIGKGFGLDEEALRVIKLIPDDWFPLMIDGKAVETKVVLPINFKLAK